MPAGLPARRWAPNPRGAGDLAGVVLRHGARKSHTHCSLTRPLSQPGLWNPGPLKTPERELHVHIVRVTRLELEPRSSIPHMVLMLHCPPL